MTRSILTSFLLFQSLLLGVEALPASEFRHQNDRVLLVAQKMETAFKEVADYRCEVDQIFYQEGAADQHYRFRFYFKKEKKIRVDFIQPYPELSLFYQEGENYVTVMPLRFLRLLKLRLSVDNPKVQTPAGQRLNQTDMGYFIDFLLANLRRVPQKEDEFEEEEGRITFVLWAMDYIKATSLEKYRVTVSRQDWLPVRIERYDVNGRSLETISIEGYAINTGLEDQIFLP
jgi:outer membrane lipoprotein-sorting protein